MFYASIQSIYAEVMFNFIVNFSWRIAFFCDFHMHTDAVELEKKISILGP